MSNFTPVSSIALLDAPMRKRVSESGVRLMQTAIFTVAPRGKDSERNLAATSPAASANDAILLRQLCPGGATIEHATNTMRTLARTAFTIGIVCQRPTVRYRFASNAFQIAAAARK